MASQDKRLEALEVAFGRNGGKDIIGVRYDDEEFVKFDDKEMPLDEFFRLYPDATLIHIVYVDQSPNQLSADS